MAKNKLEEVDAFRDSLLVMTIMPFVTIGHRNTYFHIFQFIKRLQISYEGTKKFKCIPNYNTKIGGATNTIIKKYILNIKA